MAWHVASRSALSTSGLSEPLALPLDFEYARNPAPWWRAEHRTGQLASPTSPSPPQSPLLKPLDPLPRAAVPVYAPLRTPPVLRGHIYETRTWSQIKMEEATFSGTYPLAALSTPRLQSLRPPPSPRQTPVYDGSVYDDTWGPTTSVSSYFGPPH